MLKTSVIVFLLTLFLFSCSHVDDQNDNNRSNDEESANGCSYEDGTHSATVEYYNPETGYEATYNLDVEVNDCEVIQIDFNNGGYLDDSHISPTELDSDGSCTLEDERGREFTIHLEE